MPDQLQLRGGTTAQHTSFTGASKEVTVDTTKKTAVVHDGSTVGGVPLLREDGSNSALTLGSAGTPSIKFTGDLNTGVFSPGADQVAISTGGTSRLAVSTTAVSSTLAVDVPLGAVGTPSLTFTGDTNTGIFSPGADQLAVSTGGTQKLIVLSDGKVGISTSSPTSALDISYAGGTSNIDNLTLKLGADVGNLTSRTINTRKFAVIGAANYSNATKNIGMMYLDSDVSTSKLWFGGGASGIYDATEINFVTAATTTSTVGLQRMIITSGGLVGIGTTTVDELLHLKGASTTNTTLKIESTSTASERSSVSFFNGAVSRGRIGGSNDFDGLTLDSSTTEAAASIRFRTGGTSLSPKMTLDSSGRLLVGLSTTRTVGTVASYEAPLQIETPNAAICGINLTQNRTDYIGPYLRFGKTGGPTVGSTTVVSNGDELGTIQFCGADGTDLTSVGAQIRAQVDGTPGNDDMPSRLVFSTTPASGSSPTERMRINRIGQISSYVLAGAGSFNLVLGHGSAASSSTYMIAGTYEATAVNTGTISFLVATNGNVTNTNNSYGAISDAKLKENIVDATSQWADVKAFRVRKYNFKQGQTHTQLGVVANEIELISPGLVTESPDRDAEGNDLGTVTKSVNYSVLYMKAVKALQEAMGRIETLEQRLTAAGID